MGFFEKLFGQKIENENKTKPFHENKNDAEKLDWFKRTRPWHKVDEKIINALIKKFNGNPMFEVFVITSMNHDLIPLYCKFNDSEYLDSPDLICSFIAPIFYNLGSSSLKQMIALIENIERNQEKFKLHYSIVMDSLETCVVLDENQVSAYSGLAMAKRILNRPEDSLTYAQKGIAVIKKIKESNTPFNLSENENIRNSMQTFEEIENYLTQLIAEIESGN